MPDRYDKDFEEFLHSTRVEELVREEKLNQVYQLLFKDGSFDPTYVGTFSEYLMNVYNVNPLDYFNTYIPTGAFCESSLIKDTLTIRSNLRTIDPLAFNGCENIKLLVLDEGVLAIGAESFSSCKLLERVHLPHSIEFIDENAFRNCENLETIIYNGTQEDLDKVHLDCNAFRDCKKSPTIQVNI